MFESFSLKNILLGILLGLTIIGGWMYYPTLHEHLSTVSATGKWGKAEAGDRVERIIADGVRVVAATKEKIEGIAIPESKEKNDAVTAPRQSLTETAGKDFEPGEKAGAYPARTEIVTQERAESPRLMGQVEEATQEPVAGKNMHPFMVFNSASFAESFVASIKGSTGIDLRLAQEGDLCVVYIPAAGEEEKNDRETLIYRQAGVKGRYPFTHKFPPGD